MISIVITSFKGKHYSIPIHGFAKDSKFKLLSQNKNKLVLCLEDSAETREIYPFSFSLNVSFLLVRNKLIVSYEVSNNGEDTMYFSIGSHPGINLPKEKGNLSDYYLKFEKNENLKRYSIINGLLSDYGVDYLNDKKVINLSKTIFDEDALIFKNVMSRKINLQNNGGDYKIQFDLGDSPHLGIWSKPGAPYVCIEPWNGYDDSESSSGKIEEKEGILKIEKGNKFVTHYSIEFVT